MIVIVLHHILILAGYCLFRIRKKLIIFFIVFNVSSDENKVTSINPFQANATFLYPLKTLETQRFSDIFRGYGKATLV